MVTLYIEYEYWFAAAQLILAMLGMGATLRPTDFLAVARSPKAVAIGTGIQIILVPAVAYAFIQFSGAGAGIAVGIALIAAVPGGTISNVFTHLARGNTPLSISITTLTTLACLVTTPIIMGLLITEYMPANFTMPRARIAQEITLCLLLPLLSGMLFLKLLPAAAQHFSNLCVRASLLVIALIAAGSLGSGRLDISAFGLGNVALIVLFMLTLVTLGAWLPKLLGLARADITAIEMEVVIRSINLGLMLKVSLFPAVAGQVDPIGDAVLFSLLLFGGLLLLVGIPLVGLRRRQLAMPTPA